MKWVAGLVGRPWIAGGKGPVGFDCRGLVAHVLREIYRLPVPTLLDGDDRVDPRESTAAAGWRTVTGAPREADVLLVHSTKGAHVGVFVRYGRLGVLHSVQPPAAAHGVRFDMLDDLRCSFVRPSIWRHLGQ